jgi:polysaccharide deacetylase family protein (PEP-CTERM system associated)
VAWHPSNDGAADVTLEIMIRHASHSIPARKAVTDASAVPTMDDRLDPEATSVGADVLTIDLEDWPVAVLGPEQEVTNRVLDNTRRVLQILRWHGVSATFFVLTCVAERFPELIREVHAAGHEIASHGHSHKLVTAMSPDEFREDVQRSIDVLHKVVGERPIGYRAPAFSIARSTRWAGPILSELGFKYSSSIFPISHPRYGISDAPRRIHRWKECGLLECPPATVRLAGRNWPVAGGGYFRLMPGWMARRAVSRFRREGAPAVLYLHPYEFDVGGVGAHATAGVRVPFGLRISQGLFRSRMENRLHRLLERFHFTRMCDLLAHAC